MSKTKKGNIYSIAGEAFPIENAAKNFLKRGSFTRVHSYDTMENFFERNSNGCNLRNITQKWVTCCQKQKLSEQIRLGDYAQASQLHGLRFFYFGVTNQIEENRR